jgi:hypothetical protein
MTFIIARETIARYTKRILTRTRERGLNHGYMSRSG